jgi:ferredoxin-NADP reductase
LTKKVVGPDGHRKYVLDLDGSGKPKRGPVTHSYSISSAPFETSEHGCLEFYVILERDERGEPGRLTESMFRITPASDDKLTYANRIVGDFTLAKRARGFRSVLWVGTGTGLAPFVSMIKQLHYNAAQPGSADDVQYTLLHTNRTTEELGYHQELLDIEASRRLDFAYIPTVSRPKSRDLEDGHIGQARANNLLRHVLEMPVKEQQDLDEAAARGEDLSAWRVALEKVTRPVLPRHMSVTELRRRLDPPGTVILTCGNPSLMADIEYVADRHHIHFEKEDW